MANSIHTARWIHQLEGLDWDVHVFSSVPTVVHPELRNVTVYGVSANRPAGLDPRTRVRGLWPLRFGTWHVGRALSRLAPAALAALIRRLRPDLVHSLEIQHAGYLTLAARNRLGTRFPPWIVTNWGSDISYFGRFAEHEPRIRQVLSASDYQAADCERDLQLARELGFEGEVFGVFPGGGGFDLDELSRLRAPGPPSSRRLIVLKGRQFWSGRALVAVRALELAADAAAAYRTVVLLASPEVAAEAADVARRSGIAIDTESAWIDRREVLRLHGAARTSISLGVSDGTSNSMLEALALGSLPIHSSTSCAGEWITDGENGLLVPPNDAGALGEAIERFFSDDELRERVAAAAPPSVAGYSEDTVFTTIEAELERAAASR